MNGSKLYVGQVMHRRLRPRLHQLRYSIFSLMLDLDEIDLLDRRLALFSRGRFNLLSFHDRDHGDGSTRPLRNQAMDLLRRAGIARVGRIRLLAMPRLLGFVFNPLSVYFCDSPSGRLAAIMYEVHNTFGERHTYVLPVEGAASSIRQGISKRFHVSPFLPMNLDYAFRLSPPGDKLRLAITVSGSAGPMLVAVHSARRRPLNDREIMRAVATHPLMTLKVVAAILWEATKLFIKGIAIHKRPPMASAATISIARRQRRAA